MGVRGEDLLRHGSKRRLDLRGAQSALYELHRTDGEGFDLGVIRGCVTDTAIRPQLDQEEGHLSIGIEPERQDPVPFRWPLRVHGVHAGPRRLLEFESDRLAFSIDEPLRRAYRRKPYGTFVEVRVDEEGGTAS